MMMMMMMKVVVVLVLAGVPVVQAQATDPCDGLNQKKCGKKEQCTLNYSNTCILTVGKDSVVRDGSNNAASGELCTVGGGQENLAGSIDDTYSVVGGGQYNQCYGDKNTIAGGSSNSVRKGTKFNTISGGFRNIIVTSFTGIPGALGSFNVITGGGSERDGNFISAADTGTISGGTKNWVNGSGATVTGGTVTGGFSNGFNADSTVGSTGTNSVMTGGNFNEARGEGSVVSGGSLNSAEGDYSIALGENAKAKKNNSMAVNLMKDGEELVTKQDGQFVMNAESFRFQIGNGEDKNGDIQFTEWTIANINNLNAALAEE